MIMKNLLVLVLIFCCSVSYGQSIANKDSSEQVVVDNEKMKVVQHIGVPNKAVCGVGMHHHEAHLTVAITDAEVLITSPDGKSQTAKIPAGASIWFAAGTHSAINSGDSNTKLLLVYLKD